jgi:biopolymer transport protein ExbB
MPSICNKSITGVINNARLRASNAFPAKVSGSMNSSRKWLAIVALLIPVVAMAATWWNNDWKYRKEISFDLSAAGANVAGSTQDLPVLLRFSLANFGYFSDTKPDGADFRVVAGDDKTPLKFHFEKFDAQNQIALLWVRVPQLTGGSKNEKIFAYYGNPDAAAAADVPGIYDALQVLDLSFSEGSGPPTDATAYKNNPSQSTATLTPASLIGGGAKFAGQQSITVPASPSLRLLPNQGITMSAWLRIEQTQQAVVFALSDQGKSVALAIDGAKLVARVALDGPVVTVAQASDLSLGQWHHVALSLGAGKLTLFVDGAAVGSAPVVLQELAGNFTIGAAGASGFLIGEVDEVEVAKSVRSAEWIKASFHGQGIESNLIVYGADGQREGGGQGSYFVTIAKNLTLDGWVVIGICMAMLAIALTIMIFKAIFLSRVERANARFLKEFRRLTGDTTSLDRGSTEEGDDTLADPPSMSQLAGDAGSYGASTLYRLYHHGVFELNKRINGRTVSAQRAMILSSQSIDAIRSAMDSSMTRLQQTLSSQMVLLTIAISGGPFLGLLGTVIGVMITFAAIALSGDVNINAIAPGTAAALAATVAGLAVAIPSLFGYNWLNTRIKAITADNRVFVDEFVTRIAEQYS